MAIDTSGLKRLDTSGMTRAGETYDGDSLNVTGLKPLDTSGLTRAGQQPRKEDSWLDVGRRVLENTPTMFKQAIGGLGQFFSETETVPPAAGVNPWDPQWNSIVQPYREQMEALRREGKVPGQQLYDEATRDLEANQPNVEPGSSKQYAYDIAQGIIQMIPSIAASLATRSPGAGASIIAGQVVGPRYGESRADGRTREEATADAAFDAAAEAIPEMIPLGIVIKPGTKFLPRVFKSMGAESIQEMFTEAIQTGYDTGVLDEEMTWGEAVDNLVRAGIVGAGVGGGMATITHPFVRENPPQVDNETGLPEGAVEAETLYGEEVTEPATERPDRPAPPPPTPEDIASPIPTDIIQEGKGLMDEALDEFDAGPGVSLDELSGIARDRNLPVGQIRLRTIRSRLAAARRAAERGDSARANEHMRAATQEMDALTAEGEPLAEYRGRIDFEDLKGAGRQQRGDSPPIVNVPNQQYRRPSRDDDEERQRGTDTEPEIPEMRDGGAAGTAQPGTGAEGAQRAPGENIPGAGTGPISAEGLTPLRDAGVPGPSGSDTAGTSLTEQGEQQLMERGDAELDEQTRADIAGEPPERARLIVARNYLNEWIEDHSVPPEIGERVGDAYRTLEQAISRNENLAETEASTIAEIRDWLDTADIEDDVATELRAFADAAERTTPQVDSTGEDSALVAPAVSQPVARRDVPDAEDAAVTAAGREVPVRYAVVEASDLQASQRDDFTANTEYPAELQPRDRGRAVSRQQVQDIAGKLNPRLLDRSPRASDGAPIISADGVVESGNGRVLGIRRAYSQGNGQAYRDYLAEQGYPVDGMDQPVLVRVRDGDMTPDDRQAFTREANERDTLGMSATERAMADAEGISDGLLDLYRGGEVDLAANRDFVRGFIDQVVGRNEQSGMIAGDGAMSQEATRRVEGALLAKAYGDADLVASLIESTDNNLRTIGGALMDVSAPWASMRAAAAAGSIDSSMDQTERLLEAVRLVQRARRDGRSLAEYVGQGDILTGENVHQVAEAFLRLMFRNTQSWNQPAGRDKIADALRFYTEYADRAQPGTDLLGETAAAPEQILETARERQYGKEQEQQDLLAEPAGRPGQRDREGGERPARAPEGAAPEGGQEATGTGEERTPAQEVESEPPAPAGDGPLRIEDYTEKSIIVRGDTKPHKDRIKAALPGRRPLWNSRAEGWVFPKAREEAVREALADLLNGVPAQAASLRGDPIDSEWTSFAESSGTLGIPRAEMPQIKAEHRGALANFLKARGIDGAEDTVPAASLKPTQAEFSEAKVDKAKAFTGGDRAILVSSDGHVLDGHHQWLAKADKGEELRIIRLDAPIARLIEEVAEFPSVEQQDGDGRARQAVQDSRDTAAGRLPVQDDRERQRQENIRKLEEQERDVQPDVSEMDALVESFNQSDQGADYRVFKAMREGRFPRKEIDATDTPVDGLKVFIVKTRKVGSLKEARDLWLQRKPDLNPDYWRFGADVEYQGRQVAWIDPDGKIFVPDNSEAPQQIGTDSAEGQAPAYGQANKVFTQDAAEKAREVLRRKLNQLNTGLDPEIVQAGITLAGYHIEAGARSFADYSRAMLSDLGEAARPYLRSWYEGVRFYPGFDAEGMTSQQEIDQSQPVTIEPEEDSDDGVQRSVPASDARPGAADVQPAAPDRGPGRASAEENSRGTPPVPPTDRRGADAPERAGPPAVGERGRERGTADADRVPDRGESASRRGSADVAGAEQVKGTNYRIEPGALAETRGRMQKARDNLAAIELLKELEAAGRPATNAEQQVLARYVGWGGLKDAFPGSDGKFGKGMEQIGKRLQEALSDTEYATARRSLQYAHFTAENIVNSMWEAVRRLGFDGGMVFEPGMGTGNFAGLMPADIAEHASYHGLELDHTTARIARLLYPRWGVRQDDFTRAPLPKNTYDLVIGNPPFADIPIKSDQAYPQGLLLHDYFFAKSLDGVRPGGLLAFISSAGTMNKTDAAAREYMAERADLVGAIRLPGNAFERNAGTSVTTDIIILRKKVTGQVFAEAVPADQWVNTDAVRLPGKDGNQIQGRMNRYFNQHPEMVLGEQGFFDPLYQNRYAVRAPKGFDLTAALQEAVQRLPEQVMTRWQSTTERAEVDFGTAEHKEGSFYLDASRNLMQQQDGVGRAVQRRGKGVTGGKTASEIERIEALIPLRDSLRAVYAADLAEDTANAGKARKRLNDAYDAFVEKFGPINKANFQYRRPTVIQQESARMEAREEARFAGTPWREGDFDSSAMIAAENTLQQIAKARKEAREEAQAEGRTFDEGSFDPSEMPDIVIEKRPNIDPFMDDPESYRLRAIERYNDETGEAAKSAVFYENIITKERPSQIDSINDALLHTLNQKGRLDIKEVARLAGLSESQAIEQLGEKIYRVPGTRDEWVTQDEYLSGNVRRKLRQAVAAANRDQALQRNVDALKAAQPAPLPPSEISANLGMPWIPTDVIETFGTDSLGLKQMRVSYTPALGQWDVSGDSDSAAATTTWGTTDVPAPTLIKYALNRQDPRVYREFYEDGKKTRELDPGATEAAQDKVRELKQRFSEWVWSEPERSERLAGMYNEEYNNLVVREFDGSYLTTPGVSSEWSWRPHQTRVIARIIQDGNTYMAHGVGAGKTSAMIGAGMEMRRLGLARKPMYAVPNHMLGQFTKEFYEQYPTARIAVADERRFHTSRRKQFIANVANEDLDAIIITHSAFGMIPVSDEFQDTLIQEQIDKYREILEDVGKDQENRITRSRLEKQIERLEQRLTGKSKGRRDQVFTFEEMGVDFMFVDEAHMFRKLDFATKMSNVKGISPDGSKASWDLFVKTRYLEQINQGRNLVLASGTPVTNTMAELYTVSRYLQPEELRDRGLEHFDAWAGAFGDTVTALEQDPSGGYKPVTRFAKFVNVPELSNMVRQSMDVVTSKQLEQYVTRPKIKDGQRQMNLAEKSDSLDEYQAKLARRMEDIAARKGAPAPGDDIILSVINDGRHAAIDMRLVDPELPNDPGSKLNLLVDNVFRLWKETKRQKFHTPGANGYSDKPVDTGPAAQMVFANLGLSGKRGFAVPDYIRAELVRRGVPKSQIAFISDHKTHVAKQRLFNDVNEGKVRVLIGSTAKMATGVNAQQRLYALHNLDPLWYPADDEQRIGRGLRQGNMNPEIEVHDYSTKGTYDSTMWGMMETKARFIQGFFEGDPSLRDMDDLGEASQYEQAKAMTTADPRLIELTDLRQKLERAHRRKNAHERDQYSMQRRVASARDHVQWYGDKIPNIEKDIAQRQDLKGDAFTMKVDGKSYTDRVEAGDALLGRAELMMKDGKEYRDEKVGEISGFDILIDVWGNAKNRVFSFVVQRNGENATEFGGSDSSRGTIQSLEAVLRGFEDDLANANHRLETAQADVTDYEPQLNKPFNGQEEIDTLTKQVRDLEYELTPRAEEKDEDGEQFELQTDTAAFRRWFGDSKVVDGEGKPLVVYHGSEFVGQDQFISSDSELPRYYFTDSKKVADQYGKVPRAPRETYAVYLKMENPLDVDMEGASYHGDEGSMDAFITIAEAKDAGHDGAILRNFIDTASARDKTHSDIYVVFNNRQIKSATGNRGTFDPNDPRIAYESSRAPRRNLKAQLKFTPEWNEKRADVEADLRRTLDRIGMKKVTLRVPDSMDVVDEAGERVGLATGRHFKGAIDVALAPERDYGGSVRHEAIHYLKEAGVFRPAEWATLEKAAEADTDLMGRVRKAYAPQNLAEDKLVEEAIAHMYSDWHAQRSEVSGFLKSAFERVKKFFNALRNVLRRQGFNTADEIFQGLEEGAFAGRMTEQQRKDFAPRVSESFELRDDASNDPTAPDGVQKRQKATNEWLGVQPLDQAMRLPFHIFGGVNERGEWNWGRHLSDRSAEIITNATFDENGRFAWVNNLLEKARAGLLDRYGLDPAYVERERRRGLDERQIMAQVPEIMETLRGAGVGTDEARVLQAVLTGEEVADTDMAKLAEPIRNAIDDMGAEAVQLGLLSAESYERNRGAYLHRVYMKHESDQGSLARWAARIASQRRRKIIGNQFKGRGMWIEADPGKLTRNIPGFRGAEQGMPIQGTKFRVLDKIPGEGQGTLRGIDQRSQRKVLNRIFLPADAPVPDNLMGYADRGVWEVRGSKKGKTVLWRDFSKPERESMGEIVDARYTISKTYMQMAHDLSTGRFFQDIAINADWSTSTEPRPGTWKDSQEYNRFWADPEIEWVRVPDTVIKDSSTKRYGALAGRYVRAEIWRDLAELERMQKPGIWHKALTSWKKNKTGRSPVVHMNNVMSNLMLMDMADVRGLDLARGIRSMVKKDADYQDALNHGAFGADMVAQELRQSTLQPLLEEIERDLQGGQDTMETRLGVLGKLADGIWNRAKHLDRKMVSLYQLEDEVFRMATYIRQKSQGWSANDAALHARDQFLNYDIRAPWVNAARRSVLPFISYTYRAMPVIARSVALRPWKLAKYATVAYVVNELAYQLAGGDEDEERRSLDETESGNTWLGAPRMIRMPYADAYGNPVFLDVRRWVPAGDVFDLNQGHGAIPIPAPLQFGGPLMLAGEFFLNKQAFTGEQITNDRTDDWWDRSSKTADWAWKSWMPSAAWVPGSWYWERIGRSITGARDPRGRPYRPENAIPSSFGIKLKPQDVGEAFFWKGVEFDRVESELRAEMRSLGRDYARGMISRSAYERRQQRIIEKMDRLGQERQETFDPPRR